MTPSQRDTNLNYQCVSSVEVSSYKGGLEDGGHLLSHNPSMNNPRDEITSAAEWLLSSSWSRSCKMNLTVMMWCSQSFIELHTMTQLLWSLLFMSGQRAVYIPETLPENRTWASLTAQQSVQTSSQLAGEDVCSVPQRGLQAGAEARMDADRYQKAFLSMKSCLNIYRLIMVVGITATSKRHHVERSHTEVTHILSLHFQSSSFGLWRDFSFIKGIFFIYWWGIWDWGSNKVVQLNTSFLRSFLRSGSGQSLVSGCYLSEERLQFSVRVRQPAKTIISLDDAKQTRHSMLKSFRLVIYWIYWTCLRRQPAHH